MSARSTLCLCWRYAVSGNRATNDEYVEGRPPDANQRGVDPHEEDTMDNRRCLLRFLTIGLCATGVAASAGAESHVFLP